VLVLTLEFFEEFSSTDINGTSEHAQTSSESFHKFSKPISAQLAKKQIFSVLKIVYFQNLGNIAQILPTMQMLFYQNLIALIHFLKSGIRQVTQLLMNV
jgi:hypothetical protein